MKIQAKSIIKLQELITEETEYRKGSMLVEFFNRLGFNDSYGYGFPSRWYYTQEKLNLINGTEKLKECIISLFSPANFIGEIDKMNKLIKEFNEYLNFDNYKIVIKKKSVDVIQIDDTDFIENEIIDEDEFLKHEFKDLNIENLNIEDRLKPVLEQRIDEIKKCINDDSPLSIIFLAGSTLEGILFAIAIRNPKQFNQSINSPKDVSGKVKQINVWKLSELIEVACTLGYIKEDVKKFSHVLRDFRNYIHPYQQMIMEFNPDRHTAKICCKVLEAAIYQLSNSKGENEK
jgi:hypothetical protein